MNLLIVLALVLSASFGHNIQREVPPPDREREGLIGAVASIVEEGSYDFRTRRLYDV